MKAKLVILSVVFMTLILSGCGDYVPTYQVDVNKQPLKVVSIKSLNQDLFKHMCLYRIDTGTDYVTYIDNYYVVDSIGKFNVGDAVNFTLVLSK